MPPNDSYNNNDNINNSFNTTYTSESFGCLSPTALILEIIAAIIAILTFLGVANIYDITDIFSPNPEPKTNTVSMRILGTWIDGNKTWVFAPSGRIYINGKQQMLYEVIGENTMTVREFGKVTNLDFRLEEDKLEIFYGHFTIVRLNRVSNSVIP